MRKKSKPISTISLCSYGCGNVAKFINNSNKLMCSESANSCPSNKRKNSVSVKAACIDYKKRSENLSDKAREKMGWTKGLTKEKNKSLERPTLKGKRFGVSLNGHTEETKRKISLKRTEWLKKPENRKNYGRQKRSWMELTFENYLKDNTILGWDTEVQYWNDSLKKNYFPDFIFEDKKLIIELDGTQHKNTIHKDKIRDEWFSNKGYKVIRIQHSEFKERYFSGKGFLDLL